MKWRKAKQSTQERVQGSDEKGAQQTNRDEQYNN